MKMKKILFATIFATCVGAPALAGPLDIYNAVADFSNPQTAPWSYGYTLGSPTAGFTQFTAFTGSYLGVADLDAWYVANPGFELPAVIKNTSAGDLAYAGTVVQPNTMLNLHPWIDAQGVPAFAVVRFTAPSTSLYSVDAFFQGLDFEGPTTTDVSIYLLLNNQLTGAITSYGPGGRIPYSGSLFMTAGDTLDFAVGPRSRTTPTGFYYDSTGFDATITAVPEPATLSLLGLGLVGLAMRLRARRK